MGVSVAEYLGQRTDVEFPIIQPIYERKSCPFTQGNLCRKLKKKGQEPVCSVRKEDGTLWIVCPDRLCATKKDLDLSLHQSIILLDIAKHIFDSSVTCNQIFIKREQRLRVQIDRDYKADFIMTINNGTSPYPGPNRVILEMQGGGETSDTGKLTKVIKDWKNSDIQTNHLLQQLSKASTLETNAWRRQQEQFIVKGNIAMMTWKGYGMVFCVGTLLFDYLYKKIKHEHLPNLRNHNWTLALIGIKEDCSNSPAPGPIPLMVDETRLIFTNYQTFVHALINQGEPSPEAFIGEFINLNNIHAIIE
ncbi:NotI family restriction endonuclease [Enterocloster hominis (ex Hitch et al. 2024)]|uniref:NotI family restriction endonuclease n=1 Tax=Enterocloster hominis (ex Hitch et al. 2024) TaxID=1917870 RepID=A0ABV1DBT3_9FIRM